jgi:hypothetical protein
MKERSNIAEWIQFRGEEQECDFLLMDGFDDCLVGLAEEPGQPAIALYDRALVIEQLTAELGSFEDAMEWHEHNQQGMGGIAFLDRPDPFFAAEISGWSPPWWDRFLKPAIITLTFLGLLFLLILLVVGVGAIFGIQAL